MSGKIKVLYIVSTLARRGPTNQLFNIVSNLNDDDFECKVVTLSPEAEDTLLPKFLQHGIEVKPLNLSRIGGFFWGCSSLKKVIDLYKPNIVHTQGIRSDGFAKWLKNKFGVKAVSTIRCLPNEDYPLQYGKIVGHLMAHRHLTILKGLDEVIAVSKSIDQKLSITTTVIQNGCDISRFSPVSDDEKLDLRRKLGLPTDRIVLISVGHLSARKSPLTIVRALMLVKNRKDFELIFLGDGELRPECEAVSKNEDNIRYFGRVNNVDEYLKAADAFISASLSEGLPNSVLESLACGVPVILSKIPQHQEIFESYKDEGLFFEPNNENALSKILTSLTASGLRSLPTRTIVENNFDARQMSLRYQTLYKSMVN